jgi:hypothetical protein
MKQQLTVTNTIKAIQVKNLILGLSVLILINYTSNAQKINISPIKAALEPVPTKALFKMDGYYLWDPSLIKVGEKYHLFCSRWPAATDMEGWKQSQVIRAESDSLFGPYAFAEVVLQPEHHPWATQGVSNPKIIKLKEKYLLYHLGIPRWKTGFALAENITGPWEILDNPSINANNPALTVEENGTIYVLGKHKPKPHKDGMWDAYMHGFRASNYQAEFIPLNDNVGDSLNLLPNNYELEDPTLWIAQGLYNVICNDWEGKASGINKAILHYVSKDGIEYQLVSSDPIWSHIDGIPFESGETIGLNRLERPQVFLNENNQVIALLVAALPKSGPSFIVIRPVDKYMPVSIN